MVFKMRNRERWVAVSEIELRRMTMATTTKKLCETLYLVAYDKTLDGYIIIPSYTGRAGLTVYRHSMKLTEAAKALVEIVAEEK